jgi:hypothetical protein
VFLTKKTYSKQNSQAHGTQSINGCQRKHTKHAITRSTVQIQTTLLRSLKP